ncbi:LytR/AlgR family response regulator transcription factor [Ferruginibacter sp.]
MQKTYKCLIADDNIIDRDAVEMYVGKIDNLQIAAVCNDGLEATAVIKSTAIDIVFSDIDMPDLSGLELIQTLQNAPVFIFISSYAEHAAESYHLDVIDFIVKPVSLARLIKATNKAIEYIELKKSVLNNTTDNSTAPVNTSNYFFIREDNGYTKINTGDLVFIESMGNFSRLQMLQQKKHITLVSLKNMEEQLPAEQFMRVHKQFIINLHHITAITAEGEIKLIGGEIIPVGAAYKANLLDVINKKVFSR